MHQLVVAEPFRRQGTGTLLLDAAEQLARDRRIASLGITVGLFDDYGPARRLYARRGYTPDGRGSCQGQQPLRKRTLQDPAHRKHRQVVSQDQVVASRRRRAVATEVVVPAAMAGRGAVRGRAAGPGERAEVKDSSGEHREDHMAGTSKAKNAVRCGGGGAVYGLGLIGALVHYWQHAHGFWAHVWAVVEAILWPAFVVYHLLGHIAT